MDVRELCFRVGLESDWDVGTDRIAGQSTGLQGALSTHSKALAVFVRSKSVRSKDLLAAADQAAEHQVVQALRVLRSGRFSADVPLRSRNESHEFGQSIVPKVLNSAFLERCASFLFLWLLIERQFACRHTCSQLFDPRRGRLRRFLLRKRGIRRSGQRSEAHSTASDFAVSVLSDLRLLLFWLSFSRATRAFRRRMRRETRRRRRRRRKRRAMRRKSRKGRENGRRRKFQRWRRRRRRAKWGWKTRRFPPRARNSRRNSSI